MVEVPTNFITRQSLIFMFDLIYCTVHVHRHKLWPWLRVSWLMSQEWSNFWSWTQLWLCFELTILDAESCLNANKALDKYVHAHVQARMSVQFHIHVSIWVLNIINGAYILLDAQQASSPWRRIQHCNLGHKSGIRTYRDSKTLIRSFEVMFLHALFHVL